MNRRDWINTTSLGALGVMLWPGRQGETVIDRSLAVKTKDDHIRLSSNENPYGPSPKARAALTHSADLGNRYPHDQYKALQQQLAQRHGLTPEHIFISAGSWEILRLTGMLFGRRNSRLLTCTPTFDWVLRSAEQFGATAQRIPLTADWRFDLPALRQAAKPGDLIYLCNPNNPTATTVPMADLRQFCTDILADHDVFLDEAYIEYMPGGEANSLAKLVKEYPRLIVSRTFSKLYGMAGLRVGYAIAHPDLIREYESWHPGMRISVSAASLLAAQASLEDEEFVRRSVRLNEEVRRTFTAQLDKWNVPYARSAANFVFVSNQPFQKDLKDTLAADNIAVSKVTTEQGPWLRITIGTAEEMERLMEAMGRYL